MPHAPSDWLKNTPGAQELCALFIEHFDECAANMRAALAGNAKVSAYYDGLAPAQQAASQQDTLRRVQLAFGGDWDAYAEKLHRDGAAYAALGFSYADWFSIAGAWTSPLLPIMLERFRGDTALLNDVLAAFQLYRDRALMALGESFIAASQRETLDRERDLRAAVEVSRQRALELTRWEAVFQNIGWGICITDASGSSLVQCNAALLRMFGLRQHDPAPTLESLFENQEQLWHDVGPAAIETGSASYDAIARRADGSVFPVHAEAVRIPGVEGQPVWVVSLHDLTERRQLEALETRARDLETENRHVQESSRLKSEFLANMSHELRTPLNSILGFSELLRNGEVGPLSGQQSEFVGDIHTSGKHLLRLINDILDLSKVEAGKIEFFPEEASLSALAAEVVGILRGVARESSVAIEVSVDESVDAVFLDPSRLKQVLYNYLSNAIKFTPPRGRVRLRVKREDELRFRVEVEDTGVGIAAEDMDRLFTEFGQLDAGKTKSHGGTGLGLALTRRLVEAQQGKVGVDSVPGQGCVFFAVLPLRSSTPSPLAPPARLPGSRPDAPRLLVIEDDAADQAQIVAVLRASDYAVDTASTAAQAIEALRQTQYAGITLDLLLPDGNGLALLQRIRALPGCASVPVIVISMVASHVTAAFAVQEALQKPLQEADLFAALARMNVRAPGPVLIIDDDAASVRLLGSSLTQLGIDYVVAANGLEGLARMAETTPSGIILDLVMPVLDGFGFLVEFRRHAEWDRVPILVWTTRDLTTDERGQLLRAAAGVLVKDGTGGAALLDAIAPYLPRVRPPS